MKVHAEYDTNDKSLKVHHDGKEQDKVHGLHFEKVGEKKDGANEYEMRMHQYEKDATHDMSHVHHTYAQKMEEYTKAGLSKKLAECFENYNKTLSQRQDNIKK